MATKYGFSIQWFGKGVREGVFLTMISENLPEIFLFLRAYKNAYYTQHIKKLEFVRHLLTIKFLHGRVL